MRRLSLNGERGQVLVIVAIAGNAVENVVGVTLARKGKSDLAVSVVKNSVAQIAAFLFPALVLLSLAFTTHLTFVLSPIFIGALVVTALAMWQITGDGEALLFEGAALVGLYVILATVILHEKVTRSHAAGIGMAVAAIACIAAGST